MVENPVEEIGYIAFVAAYVEGIEGYFATPSCSRSVLSCGRMIISMIISKRITNPDNNKCRIASPTQRTTTGISAATDFAFVF